MIEDKNIFFLIVTILLISIISLLTSTLGSIDVGDYAGVAKFFSGDYHSKIRVSHSFLYGVIHFPLLYLIKNFIILKIINLIYLFLIIFSVYVISGRDRKSLILFSLSPIVWYMGPWINSIQLSSLFLLWGYYFIKKFEERENNYFLSISGILIGLSWAFWDSILFFSIIFGISFLYDRKFYQVILFFFSIFLGLIPKLIVDQILFGFPFYGILRYFFGMITSILFKGVYGNMSGSSYLLSLILLLVFIPLFSYKLLSKKVWEEKKKSIIFIIFSLILIFLNFQIRYLLIIYPIILLNLGSLTNDKTFKIQVVFSVILIILVVIPYLVQINHSTNIPEFTSLIINFRDIKIYENKDIQLSQDLSNLSKDFPNETFIVGTESDSYAYFSMIYWGEGIKEFVSIEDYNLYLKNESKIFSKTFSFNPNIQERRALWVSGGINKNKNDNTNYSRIRFAISEENNINLKGFELIKKYHKLNVFEKRV